MRLSIRSEKTSDVDGIRQLTVQAFSNSEFGYQGEANLIDRLRSSCPTRLSLVALLDDRLVGHILFTRATIAGVDESLEGMGLAPMSVSPDHQRKGIGTQLVNAGLQRLRHADTPFVIVLGHASFYARLGFEDAGRYRVACPFKELPAGVFRIAVLGSADAIPPGTARYAPEFHEPEV